MLKMTMKRRVSLMRTERTSWTDQITEVKAKSQPHQQSDQNIERIRC
jgi:hypothetical protein